MLHHGPRIANTAAVTFPSILQAAASRAWTRTRPTRTFHTSNVAQRNVVAGEDVKHGDGHSSAKSGESSAPKSSSSWVSQLFMQDVDSVESIESGGRMSFRSRVDADKTKIHLARRNVVRGGAQPSLVANAAAGNIDSVDEEIMPIPHDLFSVSGGRRGRRKRLARPWLSALTLVNVDCLTAEDMTAVDPGLRPTPSDETDPPWPDITASMSTPDLLPRAVYYGTFQPLRIRGIPDPHSADELYQNLLHLRTLNPPPSYKNILHYHDYFRQFHSTRSFNLLIALAIRLSYYLTARRLLKRMQAEGISPDLVTRQLRVRNTIMGGAGWEVAWNLQMERAREEGTCVPLPIWLEFFTTERRRAARGDVTRRDRSSTPNDPEQAEKISSSTREMRFRSLMQNMPSVTAAEWARTPPRVVHHIVRAFLQMGHRQMALDATTFFFQQLPEKPTRMWTNVCRNILHLHLMPRGQRGLVEYNALRSDMDALLRARPTLRPNSTTLFGLMRPLKRTVRCGARARALVQDFVRRWGVRVVDDKVRRRLASLAIKQGILGVADTAVRSQESVEEMRKELAAEQEVKNEPRPGARVSRMRVGDALRFKRTKVEGWKWRLLRRRLWRVRNKSLSRAA